MLAEVPLRRRSFERYRPAISERLYQQVVDAARPLEAKRILQINTTSLGGGVAEILHSSVPLLRDLGVEASWALMKAPTEFYEVTKKIHNGMQGGPGRLTREEWRQYEDANAAFAAEIDPRDWDLIYVHDPQPAAVRTHHARTHGPAWMWRCHIDTASPNPAFSDRLRAFVAGYDRLVYSMPGYVLPGTQARSTVIAPAIDPLHPKNAAMTVSTSRRIVAGHGVDPDRPLVTQVSRFDPWKDPLGVIEAWRAARKKVPGLQLAIVGQAADDDPESSRVLAQVQKAARGERDLHIVANRADDRAVNAFQSVSLCVLQKSLREGFGLTVSEALWAGTPVIGGRAGGITIQVRDGRTGYLVSSVEECAQRLVALASDPARAARMGAAGRLDVQRRFLLPRLMRDELRVWSRLLRRPRAANGRRTVRAPSRFEVRPRTIVKASGDKKTISVRPTQAAWAKS